MEAKRAVFFDRDGTLMEEVNYCNDPTHVRVIPGAPGALWRLIQAGWLNIIITNQSGLAVGKITPAQYRAVEAELDRQLKNTVTAVYFSPDSPLQPTPRRKPGIGMLEEAQQDYGIDLSQSWMVGDKDIDIACGRAAGCRTVLVLTGYGEKHRACGADYIARHVVEATEIILSSEIPRI